MPLRNRVMPWGEIVARPERGTVMGNRGILVRKDGVLTRRRWTTHAWIACQIDFRGRKRPVAPPGRWTALFFADDAVALAAGHRPCGYCRREDFRRFSEAWRQVHGGTARARDIDRVLHRERLEPRPLVRAATLPNGTFVGTPEQCWRIEDGRGFRWDWTIEPRAQRLSGRVRLLTPRSIVRLLEAGYEPGVRSGPARGLTAR